MLVKFVLSQSSFKKDSFNFRVIVGFVGFVGVAGVARFN